eukprot:1955078-Rhodomonas_salina.1
MDVVDQTLAPDIALQTSAPDVTRIAGCTKEDRSDGSMRHHDKKIKYKCRLRDVQKRQCIFVPDVGQEAWRTELDQLAVLAGLADTSETLFSTRAFVPFRALAQTVLELWVLVCVLSRRRRYRCL